MAIAELCIFPLGTENPSVSKYLEPVIEEVKKSGLKYLICPMGTVVEGEMSDILKLAERCHRVIFQSGARRVVISLRIDDRIDKKLTIEGKLGV